MADTIQAKSVLISVFNKTGLEPIIRKMNELNIKIYSTGGTQQYIESLGIECVAVEQITQYPSILAGRVKTLHPKIFGGILSRRENVLDKEQVLQYEIPQIDIVIVDLYPFEKTIEKTCEQEQIIEKIDIGGVSLIRAAAKNFNDVLCVCSPQQYEDLYDILSRGKGETTLKQRKNFASKAFALTSHYDSVIFNYFNREEKLPVLSLVQTKGSELRYGENPHQRGMFFGDLDDIFEKINGKELSYNNLLDIDAAVNLMFEFKDCLPTFAILKHNNACGIATRETVSQAYKVAFECDSLSAFGGVFNLQ